MIEKIANLVLFYEGGLEYSTARMLPLPELVILHNTAKRINDKREREMKKAGKK